VPQRSTTPHDCCEPVPAPGVSTLPLAYHSPTTRLPRACHSPATRLPLACHSPATRLPLAYHSPATRLPLAYHSPATRLPLACHSPATRLPLACHAPATRLPLAYHSPASMKLECLDVMRMHTHEHVRPSVDYFPTKLDEAAVRFVRSSKRERRRKGNAAVRVQLVRLSPCHVCMRQGNALENDDSQRMMILRE